MVNFDKKLNKLIYHQQQGTALKILYNLIVLVLFEYIILKLEFYKPKIVKHSY